MQKEAVKFTKKDQKIWFTSDTHYGHSRIIQYCKRPFASVEEMDEALISNWNAIVSPGDIVYHLGDFAVGGGKAGQYLYRLNGDVKFVRGNHDNRLDTLNKELLNRLPEPADGLDIEDLREISVHGQKIVLCHYAMKIWNKNYRGAWHLYGHSHGTLPYDPNSLSLDVGVDCWNYSPVSFEQIQAAMVKKRWQPIDHHGTHTN